MGRGTVSVRLWRQLKPGRKRSFINRAIHIFCVSGMVLGSIFTCIHFLSECERCSKAFKTPKELDTEQSVDFDHTTLYMVKKKKKKCYRTLQSRFPFLLKRVAKIFAFGASPTEGRCDRFVGGWGLRWEGQGWNSLESCPQVIFGNPLPAQPVDTGGTVGAFRAWQPCWPHTGVVTLADWGLR